MFMSSGLQQVIRVYSLPDGTFSSEEEEDEEDEEEDEEDEGERALLYCTYWSRVFSAFLIHN